MKTSTTPLLRGPSRRIIRSGADTSEMILKMLRPASLLVLLVPSSSTLFGAINTVVYEQPLLNANTAHTSNEEIGNPGVDFFKVYENFTLPGPETIHDVHWFGSFDGPIPASPGEIDFLVQFWNDGVGLPDTGTPIASFTFDGGLIGQSTAQVMKTAVAAPLDFPTFEYWVDLPADVALDGGVQYWLSIQAQQTFPNPPPPQALLDPNWGWHVGQGPGDDAWSESDILGNAFVSDVAFSLTSNVEIPEPASVAVWGMLLLVGVAATSSGWSKNR